MREKQRFPGSWLGLVVCSWLLLASSGLAAGRTVDDVLDQYGQEALARLLPAFLRAEVGYPPQEVVFLAMKEEAQLEVWARGEGAFVQVKTYPIRKGSGRAGPKLREGDLQVPEGIYSVTYLNPNSSYHLSMKIDYPNEFDLQHARREGRRHPGGNIFIHGKAVSIGCLAMGDRAIEELFVLAAEVGIENISVIIAPHDARQEPLDPTAEHLPVWVDDLYESIETEFHRFR